MHRTLPEDTADPERALGRLVLVFPARRQIPPGVQVWLPSHVDFLFHFSYHASTP